MIYRYLIYIPLHTFIYRITNHIIVHVYIYIIIIITIIIIQIYLKASLETFKGCVWIGLGRSMKELFS